MCEEILHLEMYEILGKHMWDENQVNKVEPEVSWYIQGGKKHPRNYPFETPKW